MAADSDALRKRLGALVRELRTARRWSQEGLAARAGLSYKFVGEVERGIANPTVSTLAALAAALEVELGALFVVREPSLVEQRYPLSPSELAAVREARESLDGILRRLDVAGGAKRTSAKRKRRRR